MHFQRPYLPHDPLEIAYEKAEKVRQAITARKIPHKKSKLQTKHITVSIGVSTVIPSVTKNSREILASADTALYKAKESGRNRVAQ
ncbi:MAG: diguanylate cyclase [Thermotogota bacterium]|nr:diguanylate cyclase [Thermotogota bacterium]